MDQGAAQWLLACVGMGVAIMGIGMWDMFPKRVRVGMMATAALLLAPGLINLYLTAVLG